MTKLQKISLGIGVFLLVASFINFVHPFVVDIVNLGVASTMAVIFKLIVRILSSIFAGNIADILGRSMLLFGAIALIHPGVGLIVVSLLKPKNDNRAEVKNGN